MADAEEMAETFAAPLATAFSMRDKLEKGSSESPKFFGLGR